MITCPRIKNCKVIGVIPGRVQRGYHACRHEGINVYGIRCQFITFPEVDLEKANRDILEGKTLAHALKVRRLEK